MYKELGVCLFVSLFLPPHPQGLRMGRGNGDLKLMVCGDLIVSYEHLWKQAHIIHLAGSSGKANSMKKKPCEGDKK